MAFINNYDAVRIWGEGRLAFKITNDITVVWGHWFRWPTHNNNIF
jgi:hypothetical protein